MIVRVECGRLEPKCVQQCNIQSKSFRFKTEPALFSSHVRFSITMFLGAIRANTSLAMANGSLHKLRMSSGAECNVEAKFLLSLIEFVRKHHFSFSYQNRSLLSSSCNSQVPSSPASKSQTAAVIFTPLCLCVLRTKVYKLSSDDKLLICSS